MNRQGAKAAKILGWLRRGSLSKSLGVLGAVAVLFFLPAARAARRALATAERRAAAAFGERVRVASRQPRRRR